MRVLFAGTPEFARVALEHLYAGGHTIALVLTQPDRPAGRGMKLHASPVKQFALDHGIAVAQPRSLRLDGKYPADAASAQLAIANAQADVMVVAAYGLILPQWVLDAMATAPRVDQAPSVSGKFGCLNIHGSLLPRWRGAAPIHRAIESGDRETGITIMQMDAGLDTGDMLLTRSLLIHDADTTATLHDRMADLGGKLIVQALDLAAAGRLTPMRQSTQGVTYARKIEKSEALIDWRLDAQTIVRRVRAFNPFPVATVNLNGEVLKVWAAQIPEPACDSELANAEVVHKPGTIIAVSLTGIAVAALNSVVVLTQLQRAGGKRMLVADFLRGFDVRVGMRFALPTRDADKESDG